VLILLGLGLTLGLWQPVSLAELMGWGRAVSDMPLVIGLVLLIMALLFAFGLPGSFGIWLIAPFQPPLVATALLLVASVSGALGGYAISRRLAGDWQPQGASRRLFQLLERRSDFLTQTALRVLPGFPHSVINFAGGVLLLPLLVFTASAMVGLSVKWAVYSTALYGLADAVETGAAVQATTLAPLVILSVLLLLGTWARHMMLADRGSVA
jgi:uncharacterized membrane protein YdjX (TVP38/TMEM64 family)